MLIEEAPFFRDQTIQCSNIHAASAASGTPSMRVERSSEVYTNAKVLFTLPLWGRPRSSASCLLLQLLQSAAVPSSAPAHDSSCSVNQVHFENDCSRVHEM